MKNKIIAIVMGIAIIGGGAFYAGMKYGQSDSSTDPGQGAAAGFANLTPEQRQQRLQQMGVSGAGLRNGNRGGGGFVSGEVISKDDPAKDGAGKSITIKLPDGSSKIIFYSGTTQIGKMTNGTSNDMEIGKTVSVNGSANSDGSITAQSIQIRPLPATQ